MRAATRPVPRCSSFRASRPEPRRRSLRILRLLCALPLTSCAVMDYMTAAEAPDLMTGLSADDLRLCAGLPERTAKGTDGAEFWSYERTATAGSGTLNVPGFGGISLTGGEECRATVELREGRVSRMAFTRVSSPMSCAALVETCKAMVDQQQLVRSALAPAPESVE